MNIIVELKLKKLIEEKINIKTKRSESTRLSNNFSNSYINGLSLMNNYLWISTQYKLLCYNTNSEVIVPFNYIGNVDAIKDRIDAQISNH